MFGEDGDLVMVLISCASFFIASPHSLLILVHGSFTISLISLAVWNNDQELCHQKRYFIYIYILQQKFEKDNQELGQYFNVGIKVAIESFNSECTLPSKSSNFQVLFPWMSIQEFSMSRFPSSEISLIPRKKKKKSKIVEFR